LKESRVGGNDAAGPRSISLLLLSFVFRVFSSCMTVMALLLPITSPSFPGRGFFVAAAGVRNNGQWQLQNDGWGLPFCFLSGFPKVP
jgi:hypothetical protein